MFIHEIKIPDESMNLCLTPQVFINALTIDCVT